MIWRRKNPKMNWRRIWRREECRAGNRPWEHDPGDDHQEDLLEDLEEDPEDPEDPGDLGEDQEDLFPES